MERLAPGSLHAYVADGTEIWLDGGHNQAGGQVIAHTLAELDERVPRPVHLIYGMMETKDAHAFIAPFKGLVERVFTVTDDQIRAAMRLVWERMKLIVEPSGAVGAAVVLSETFKSLPGLEKVGVVFSGGNVNLDKLWW